MKNKVQQWHVHTGHYMGTTPQWQTVNTNYNYIVKVKIHIYVGVQSDCYFMTLRTKTDFHKFAFTIFSKVYDIY